MQRSGTRCFNPNTSVTMIKRLQKIFNVKISWLCNTLLDQDRDIEIVKYFDRQNVEIVKHLARSTASSPPTTTTTAHKTNPVNDQLFIVCKNNHNNLLAHTWYLQNLENNILTPRPFLCPGNCSALTEAGGVHLRLFSQTAVYRAAATALLRRGSCAERKPTSWQRREIETENRAIEVYVTIWNVKKVEEACASLFCLNSIYFPK